MSTAEMLLLAGAVVLGAGIVAGAGERLASVAAFVEAAGMALLGIGGAVVLFTGAAVGASFRDAVDPAFGVDRLSGFLLATVAIVAVPAMVYARGYLAGAPRARALVPLSGLFLLSLVGVVVARSAFPVARRARTRSRQRFSNTCQSRGAAAEGGLTRAVGRALR